MTHPDMPGPDCGWRYRPRRTNPRALLALLLFGGLVALVVWMASARAGAAPAAGPLDLVAESYRALLRWTSTQDPTDQSAAVKRYSREGVGPFLLAAESAVLECEPLQPALAAWTASYLELQAQLDSPAELALLREHGRHAGLYLEEVLASQEAACAPDWTVLPTGGGSYSVLQAGTGKSFSSADPLTDLWGADHRSTTAQNRPRKIAAGDLIQLAPGDYPTHVLSMSYDRGPDLDGDGKVSGVAERAFGADPITVFEAAAPGTSRIVAGPYDGTYLEWAGAVEFRGIAWDGHGRATIKTENPGTTRSDMPVGRWDHGRNHQGFRDVRFYGCEIRGPWDASTGAVSGNGWGKWGLQAYELGPSALGTYGFVWSGGRVFGMEPSNGEHAFYFHNTYATDRTGARDPNGLAVLIEEALIYWCPRTAVQDVNRVHEGPDGCGTVHLRNLAILDVCLEQGGGGSAITCRGNRDGELLLEGVRVRLGCQRNLHANYQRNITGALMVDSGDGAEGRGTRKVTVRDCDFEVGRFYPGVGSARRPNVNLQNIGTLRLERTRIYNHAGTSAALQIAPGSMQRIELDDDCEVVGDVKWAGVTYHDPRRDGAGWRALLNYLRANPDPKVSIF